MYKTYLKKYIRILARKLMSYTEKEMDVDTITKYIDAGQFYMAQIKIDKLQDQYGYDPLIQELQNMLDCAQYPPELILSSSEDEIIDKRQLS